MAKRSSTNPLSSRPSSSMSAATVGGGRISPGITLRDSPSLQPRISRSQSASKSVSLFESSSSGAPSPSPAPLSPRTPPAQPLEESFEIHSVSNYSISTVLDSPPGPRESEDDHKSHRILLPDDREVYSPTSLTPDVTVQLSDKTLSNPGSPVDSVKNIPVLSPTDHYDPNDTSITDLSTATVDVHEKTESEHPSYLFSEPSTRISAALSDGETGIGFALLQDFVNGTDDSDYSDEDPRSRASSPISMPPSAPPTSRRDDVQTILEPAPLEISSNLESEVATSPTLSFSAPPHHPSSPSVRSFMSRGNTDSEYGGEEWEGASDIYDNYRYSRYSVASKMSRFSRGSMHTVGSGIGLGIPPPVPVDSARPSLDSIRPRFNSTESIPRPSLDSVSRQSPVTGPTESMGMSPTATRAAESKHVPSPLTFAPEITTSRSQEGTDQGSSTHSPLLHATFGSPGLSSNDESLFSPPHPPSPPHVATSTAAGAASALRQRLEMERESRPASPVAVAASTIEVPDIPTLNRQSHQPIIVEDDNEDRGIRDSVTASTTTTDTSLASPNSAITSVSASTSTSAPSPTPTSPLVSEKMAMRSQFVVMNPGPNAAPPPPYTPTSPPAASSSHPHRSTPGPSTVPLSPTAPSSRQVPQPRPAPTQPLSPSSRQSLFLPHPNAPKPSGSSAGPLYGRAAHPSMMHPPHIGPSTGTALHTIQMALSNRYDALGRPKRPTIYGKLEQELSMSIGPVPISFSLEPPNNIPANRINTLANRPSNSSLRSGTPVQSPQLTQNPPLPSSTPPLATSSPEPSGSTPPAEDISPSKVIPRANFFPKAPTARPRSRSFSGFDSPFPEIELPKDKKGRR